MPDRTERIKSLRREPPSFRQVIADRIADLTPHMRRITFGGSELQGLVIDKPASSVRLLMPSSASHKLVIPQWNGNEFLLPGDRRPLIRTLTPRYLRSNPVELDVDVVVHGDTGLSGWAKRVQPGDAAAISGPGRGYEIDPAADPLLLLGDESAIPAIAQLLEATPPTTPVVVHIEVAHADARLDLPDHPNASIDWHDLPPDKPPWATLAVGSLVEGLSETARVWAAGEAAGVQRVRKLLTDLGVDRSQTTVRGYWKIGRAGPG